MIFSYLTIIFCQNLVFIVENTKFDQKLFLCYVSKPRVGPMNSQHNNFKWWNIFAGVRTLVLSLWKTLFQIYLKPIYTSNLRHWFRIKQVHLSECNNFCLLIKCTSLLFEIESLNQPLDKAIGSSSVVEQMIHQGILKGEVSLYCWHPVWLVWISLFCK